MTRPNPRKTDKALENEDYEELVEIDQYGNVYLPNDAPRNTVKKPTLLRDPKGEY
jgi:hypothetical protein